MKRHIHIHLNAPVVKTRDSTRFELAIMEDPEDQGRYAASRGLTEAQILKDFIAYGVDKNSLHARKYLAAFRNAKKSNATDALSLAEAERELKNELKLIEVFKKSGKPVPNEMIQRQKMLEEEVEKAKVKFGDASVSSSEARNIFQSFMSRTLSKEEAEKKLGSGWSIANRRETWILVSIPSGTNDAIGETFPTLAAAKAKVEKLADMGIRAKVNQEVDEATKKMYFVVVRLPSGDAAGKPYEPDEIDHKGKRYLKTSEMIPFNGKPARKYKEKEGFSYITREVESAVVHDAGFSNQEYNPREVARLKDQLKKADNDLASGKLNPGQHSKLVESINKELKGFRS